MYDYFQFPTISPTSGIGSDGLLMGNIMQSDLTAAILVTKLVPIVEVIREDMTATGALLTDVTAEATNTTTDDFAPFNGLGAVSLGDSFYFRVSDNKECDRIHVMISTPGVGDYTIGIQEWDAVAEVWVDMGSFVDGSNSFKSAAGVYTLSWIHSKKGALRIHHTDSAKHVWHRVKIKTLTGITTSPILSRLWAEDTKYQYTDMTSYTNSGDWTGFSSEFLPTINTYSAWVHPGPAIGADVTVSKAASGTYTTTREYLASDNTWKPLPNFVDPSNDYTILGTHRIRWTRPTDWASNTHITSTGALVTGWIERRRISAISTQGPVDLHETQTESRSLGSSNSQGLELGTTSYSFVTFSCSQSSTSNTVLSFINADTGDTRSATIPANTKDSSNITGGKLSFSPSPLTFSSGNSLLVMCLSGGPLTDVTIRLH